MDLIVGAGITGLSYAAATSNDYLVIEKEPEIGVIAGQFYKMVLYGITPDIFFISETRISNDS